MAAEQDSYIKGMGSQAVEAVEAQRISAWDRIWLIEFWLQAAAGDHNLELVVQAEAWRELMALVPVFMLAKIILHMLERAEHKQVEELEERVILPGILEPLGKGAIVVLPPQPAAAAAAGMEEEEVPDKQELVAVVVMPTRQCFRMLCIHKV